MRNFAGHPNSVVDVTLSPDGKTVLSGCADSHARLWDAASGKLLKTLEGPAWSVAFTRDGKQAITGSANGWNGGHVPAALRRWDVASGIEIQRLADTWQSVSQAAISPDGNRLLAVGNDGIIRAWDLHSGKVVKTIEDGIGVTAVAFMSDGKRFICSPAFHGGPAPAIPAAIAGGGFVPAAPPVADAPYGLSLRDLATGKEIKQFGGHRNLVTCFAVSADGRRLIAGISDSSMRLWELPK
jgi:WD40 repeat protein